MTLGWLSRSQELAQILDEEVTRLQEVKRQKTQSLALPQPVVQEQPVFVQGEQEIEPSLPSWAQIPTTTPMPTLPSPPTEITPKEKEWQWWEKPAEVTEWGMTKTGEIIKNLPVVPEILKHPITQKAFEGMEWMDKSWAAVTVGNLAPDVSWQSGENWLEHQRRRYEEWEAPTYVKGLTEAANPIFFIPWLGWAGRGAKLAIAGGKTIKALDTLTDAAMLAAKSGKGFIAPTFEQFTKSISSDNARKFALWAQERPVIGAVVKAVGGEAAFIRQAPRNLADEARNAAIYRAVLNDRFANIANVKIRRVYQSMQGSSPEALFPIKDGLLQGVKPIGELQSTAWNDVLSYPKLFKWKNPVAEATALEIGKYTKLLKEIAEANGVKIPQQKALFPEYFQYVNRVVEGKLDPKTAQLIRTKFTDPFAHIVYDTALEGMKAGVKYSDDVMGNLELFTHAISRRIATKKFDKVIQGMGKLAFKRWMEMEPELAEQYTTALGRITSSRKVAHAMKNAIPGAGNLIGKPVRSNYLDMLRDLGEGELADRIAQTQVLKTKDLLAHVYNLPRDVKKFNLGIKIVAKPMAEALAKLPAKTNLEDVFEVVFRFLEDEQQAMRITERLYEKTAKGMIKENANTLLTLRDQVDAIAKREMAAYKPIKSNVGIAKQTWGKADIFRNEAKFKVHPAFGKYIFPKEVVDTLEPMLVDKGNKWLRNMAAISGVSQASVASLDVSAPFIQGLALFGRNPIAWADATYRMMKVVARPQNLYTELVKREASILDRVAHGGTSVMADIFESVPALEKLGKKLGGKVGERAIRETFGRGATAYLAFGEIAKDELWKAGKVMIAAKKGLTQEAMQGQMNELARSADRMTGIMSSAALGIPLSQRQLERAWIFFAPQYTRAGLSFAGNLLKGGFTGAEARKAMLGLLGGGLTFYKAASDALEQPMNLDPRSARFMTIKIGDSHVGVGGIYYGLTRLMAEVMATAGEDWTELLPTNLSRVDNPFYKFMYGRSSQLTGLTFGLAIEHKNFLGEPFENVGDYAKFLAEKVTPISMQSFLPQKDKETNLGAMGVAAGTQFLGAREFPLSTWEERDAMRDNLATQAYGKPWADITRAEQRVIEKNNLGLLQLQETIAKRQIQRGKPKDILYNDWKDEIDNEQVKRDQTIAQAAEIARRTGDMYAFRKKVEDIENDYAAVLTHIEENPVYKPVLEMLNEPKSEAKLSQMQLQDIEAYNWQKNRYSKKMLDENGEPAWDKIEEFSRDFSIKFGEEALNYVENVLPISGRNLPPLYLELRNARQLMKPYWAVLTDVQGVFGEPATPYEKRRQDRVVSSMRKRMRLQNPELNRYYTMFYRRVV